MQLSSEYDVDVLVKMYEEHTAHGRHSETQRAQTMNMLFIVLVGTIGFLGSPGPTLCAKARIAWLIPLIGIFGIAVVTVFRAKWERSMAFARVHRRRIDALCPLLNIGADRVTAEKAYHAMIPRLLRWRLFAVWYVMCIAILVGGIFSAVSLAPHIHDSICFNTGRTQGP